MDRNVKYSAVDWIVENLAGKYLISRNKTISVADIRKLVTFLLKLPVIEPTGHLVHFRERGLQSGLIGLIQHIEDLLTQCASTRAELELYVETNCWSLLHLGTLADDSCESGSWESLDSLLLSRLHSNERSLGMVLDADKVF